MSKNSELIVMLTHNDKTVPNAYSLFDECKNTEAKIWGMKEQPLPVPEMKRLYSYMRECGKKTALEVVAYSENECIDGAKIAVECGCDILMGTIFYDSVNQICIDNDIKYMPFIGNVSGRPSILRGSIDDMLAQAKDIEKKGIYGYDFLGYRYDTNKAELNSRFVAGVALPVCIAGSIDSYERLDEIKKINPSYFTIGGAFFEHKFGSSLKEQIDTVCNYMKNGDRKCF